jgi:hypothetical protein
MEYPSEPILLVDLLAKKMDSEPDAETKKQFQKLINKIKSCVHAPLNTKEALRMQPFSENNVLYDAVLEIAADQRVLGFRGYPPEVALQTYAERGSKYWQSNLTGFGLRWYDSKVYWYLMALLVNKLSDSAEQFFAEMIDGIVDANDYMLMERTLGFFSTDKTENLKQRLQARSNLIMNRK